MAQVYVYHDSQYAPCSFLVVKEGGSPYKEQDTVLVQCDMDFPSLASNLGFSSDLDIDGARQFLFDHLEEPFEDPGYFS